MTKWRLHAWLTINLGVAFLYYFYPFFMNTPLWVTTLVSKHLLQSKQEIKQEYTRNVPWWGIVGTFIIIAVFIALAFTGYTEKINLKITYNFNYIVAIIIGVPSLIFYIMQLCKIRSDHVKT